MNNVREKVETTVNKVNDTNFSINNGKVHIFPFIIRNGYQNVTEVGFVPKGENPYFYSFFQKVFTGRETITATWEDSTELNVRDANKGTYNYDFKVGKYYEGMIVPGSYTQTLDIDNVNGNEGFLAMQESNEITIVFSRNEQTDLTNELNTTDFIPTEDDLFKLYLIPETTLRNKWLYISNVNTYTNPKNANNILTEVTFTSLKDKLETSGRALEQYVQYAAPGEPYAFPYVTSYGEVIVSPLRFGNDFTIPVKYLQVELQGASAVSSVTICGRRLYWDNVNNKFYTSPSKLLFPYIFVNPQANPLNKTSAPTKNFYCFPCEEVETRSTQEWLTAIKAEGTELAPIKNMGSFTMTGTWSNGYHFSNNITGSATHHKDYNDRNWKPLSELPPSTQQQPNEYTDKVLAEKDITGNVYCTDKVRFDRNDNMIQLLIKNSMLNMTQLELPLSMKQTRPYRWSNIPIIGFWTRWFGDRAITQNTINVSTHNICYFIDTNIATLANNAYVQSSEPGKGYGNLQIFNGEDAPALLNPQAANTTLTFELTDLVTFRDTYDNTVKTIPTEYLSQKQDENGNWFHNDHSPILLNCNTGDLTTAHCDYGFIIDTVLVNALHIGKIKISCFGGQTGIIYGDVVNPIFTQTVMSNSMFELNNIRNWTTDIILGCWDSNWSNGNISWPLQPQKDMSPTVEFGFVGAEKKIAEIEEGETRKYTSSDDVYRPGTNAICNWRETASNEQTSNLQHCAYISNAYEQTITYSQLSAYSTKADFLNHFSAMCFDVSKTEFHYGTAYQVVKPGVVWEDIKSYDANLSGKVINFDFSKLVDDELNIKQALGSFNCNYNNPLFPINNIPKFNLYWGFFDDWNKQTESGIQQVLDITIKLLEEGIRIKIIERLDFYGYGWPGGNRYEDFVRLIHDKSGYCFQLNSTIKIPYIKLINK